MGDKCRLVAPVLWLYGPGGAGKSAIMQTLCQRPQTADLLAGSFFFKRRHPTRGNGTLLFATLSYQLAIHNTLRSLISETVARNPSVVRRSTSSQPQELIVRPCQSTSTFAPWILIIDGLDECDGRTAQQEILCLLGRAFGEQSPPLRIIIASRPEPDIREVYEEPAFQGLYETPHIEIIRRCQSIPSRRILPYPPGTQTDYEECPQTMASSRIFQELFGKSSGYFIYDATVIKFVDDRDFRPTERLEALRLLKPASPFADLDQMYHQILSTVPVSVHPRLSRILCAMMEWRSIFSRT